MGPISTILDVAHKVARKMRKMHAYNYIDIETPISEDTFLTKNGSLLSIYEVHGLSNLPGKDEVERAINSFHEYLRTVFASSGQTISFVNDVDDSRTNALIEHAVAGQRKTAKRLGIEMQDIIDSNVNELSKFVTYDRSFIAIWTHISAIPATERAFIIKDRNDAFAEYAKQQKIKLTIDDAINVALYYPELMDKHEAAMRMLESALERADLRNEKVTCSDAGRELRMQIESEVPFNLAPLSLGEAYMPRTHEGNTKNEDYNDALMPRFDRQLTRQRHYESEENTWKVGDRHYSAQYVDIFPARLRSIISLKKAIPKSVPYRINILLNNGEPASAIINNILSSFLFWAHSDNKLIYDANQYMSELYAEGKDEKVKLQICVVTHAETSKGLKRNREMLNSAFAEWGRAALVTDIADPKELYLMSVVGASPRLPIEAGVAPTNDVATMLPIYRAASQWSAGSVLFANNEGKLMPFQPSSSIQEASCTAAIARPRQGKSVLLNSIIMALATKAGLTRLPRITALDIGNSTEGAIDAMADSLPENQKYLVQGVSWQQSEEFATNPMDIQLGLDRPLPFQMGILHKIIMLLVTEPGLTPREGMPALVTALVDEAYKQANDPEHIKRWAPGIAKELDKAIDEFKIEVLANETTFKEIRDAFFDLREYRFAELAQGYHVPSLEMLPEIATGSQSINREFGEGSVFNITNYFSTMMRNALRRYPSLVGSSKLDLSTARILAIDLTQVAPKGNTGEALKDTSVMYAVAAAKGTSDFYLDSDHVSYFDEKYQAYQAERISDLSEDEKVIQFDELHRPAASPIIVDMIEQFQLEGPKYKVGIHLISQKVEHFKGLLANCTNIFILGEPSAQEIVAIDEQINLTTSEREILTGGHLHGPKPGGGGSALLHRTVTRDGTFSQLLRFPYGAIGLWALNTSGDDKKLRRMMVARYGGELARRILASEYRQATIKDEIERRRNIRSISEGEFKKSIIDEIFEEIVSKYKEEGLKPTDF